MTRAYIIGAGLTKFTRYDEARTVESLAAEAIGKALADADIEWSEVQQFYAAHVKQGVAAGQRVAKQMGPSGIPVLNIENCAAAGSTAVREAALAVRAGEYDLVVVAGFEKMDPGLLSVFPEHDPRVIMGLTVLPMRFALMGVKHMHEYGTTIEQFAQISVKNHEHAARNPYAQYPVPVSLTRVLESRMICDPITVLQCSPTSDGAAAVVICSETFLKTHDAQRAVRILASGLTSDRDEQSRNAHTLELMERAAGEAYERAGIAPADVDVAETHDCFTVSELIGYEALGLCSKGEGGRLVDERATWLGGRIPVNPSGGLLARGHPLGATGVAQMCEIVTQLRHEAGPRQVDNARIGLTANTGMWSCCVTLFEAAA